MKTQIVHWHEELTRQTGLNQATITEYVRDASQFAAWLQTRGLRADATTVTVQEAKHYRNGSPLTLGAHRQPSIVLSSASPCSWMPRGTRWTIPFARLTAWNRLNGHRVR